MTKSIILVNGFQKDFEFLCIVLFLCFSLSVISTFNTPAFEKYFKVWSPERCSCNIIRITSLCSLSFSSSPLGSTRAMQHIIELPERLRSTPAITLALSINQAFLERNPVRVLRFAKSLNFLQSCALHRHLVSCRRDLLLIYSHGYSSRNCRFPLDRLSQLLALDASLTARLCQAYGVEVTQENQVVFSKAAFTEPEQGKLHCTLYHNIVAEKQKDLTIENIIHG